MEQPTETIRQSIISDLVLVNAIQRMPHIMDEVTAHRKEYAAMILMKDLSDKIADAKDLIADIEGEIAQDVRNAVDDESGKPVYKNEESRKIAVRIELKKNDDWRKVQNNLSLLKGQQVDREIKFKCIDADIKYLIMEHDLLLNLFKLAAGLSGEENTRAEREIASIGSAIRTLTERLTD